MKYLDFYAIILCTLGSFNNLPNFEGWQKSMKPVYLAQIPPKNYCRIFNPKKVIMLLVKHKLIRISNLISVEKFGKNYVVESTNAIYLVGETIGISDESPILNECYIIQLVYGAVKIPHVQTVHPCNIFIPGYTFVNVETGYSSYIVCLKQ